MPEKGQKAVIKSPFDYHDVSDDQPSIPFLQAGLKFEDFQMATLRHKVRTKMDHRGLMGGERLDSNKYVDPSIGLVTLLIKDIRHEIGDIPGVSEKWIEYAIRCIIHIERRNKVRTKEWSLQHGQSRRSTSSSGVSQESVKRKRSATPMRETNDDEEPRRKLVALSLDASSLIMISTDRDDTPSMPSFDFECHEICTRVGEENVGFLRADYDKYREILTLENLLQDETDEIYGYFPGSITWRKILTEFSFRSSLTAQFKNDPQSALRFQIRKAPTVTSGPAPASTKSSGGIDDRGREHEQHETGRIEVDINSKTATTATTGPAPSDEAPQTLPNDPAIVRTTEEWWSSYNVQPRDSTDNLDDLNESQLEPQSDTDQRDNSDGEEEEPRTVDFTSMFNYVRDSSACEQFTPENIEATCTMFRHPLTKVSNKDMVPLQGLRKPLQIIQAFAIYVIMTMCHGLATGCLLADEMGFGKTMTAYGWIVVNRWLVLMWDDIDKAREQQTGKHLPAGSKAKPQDENAVCPTQNKWPLACPCVERHPTSEFRPSLGITIVHTPPRLILNWINEFEKFVDPFHPRLQFRFRVAHGTAVQKYHFDPKEAKDSCWKQTLESSRYIVICTYPSWTQMESLFMEKITSYERPPGLTAKGNPHKEQKKTASKLRLYPAAQVMDECHETKGASTGAMRKFFNNTRANEECKSLFMSGTPWSQSPAELQGIIGVLATEDWEKDAELKYACDAPFQELVTSYKRLLQKEEHVETDLQLQREMKRTTNRLAGILERIMLRRTSESRWFDGPIIQLTEHESRNVEVVFPDEHRQALDHLKAIDKEKEAKVKRDWEERHPNQPYSTPLNQYFKWSYKQRAVATIPGLATLLERNEDSDFTWASYTKKKYLADKNNPFLANVAMLTKSCPKLNFIVDLIGNLGTMQARVYLEDGVTTEVATVPEKLVVVSTNPVICAIFERALQLRYPEKVITFVHSKLSQAQRQGIIDAFQANSPNSADVLVGPMGILGTGYTLTRARQIVICDPDWEEWKGLQAEFRIHRFGQMNPTQAWFLWCLDVPIEATLKQRHESRRRLKQKTERKDREAERWARSEREREESARQAAIDSSSV